MFDLTVSEHCPPAPEGFSWHTYTYSPMNDEAIGWEPYVSRKPNERDDSVCARARAQLGQPKVIIVKPEFEWIFRQVLGGLAVL